LIFNAFLPPLIFEAALYIRLAQRCAKLTLRGAHPGHPGGGLLLRRVTTLGMHYWAHWSGRRPCLFGVLISSHRSGFGDRHLQGKPVKCGMAAGGHWWRPKALLNDSTAAVGLQCGDRLWPPAPRSHRWGTFSPGRSRSLAAWPADGQWQQRSWPSRPGRTGGSPGGDHLHHQLLRTALLFGWRNTWTMSGAVLGHPTAGIMMGQPRAIGRHLAEKGTRGPWCVLGLRRLVVN